MTEFLLDDTLQPVGRCPRCGYVLTYDGQNYRCHFCGYPQTRPTLTDMIQELERNLKITVHSLFSEITRRLHPQQLITYYPLTMPQQRPCIECRISLPFGIQYCPKCGAAQFSTPINNAAQRRIAEPKGQERRVFDYIVAHDGTISLSKAAQDLSLSLDALQLTIERLKASGLLNQA